MSFKGKLVVFIVIAALAVGILHIGTANNSRQQMETEALSSDNTENVFLWYSDEALEDFFTKAAVAFHEKHPEIRVIPQYVTASEYLEYINEASIEAEDYPDLFVLTNDSLEKAYLSGLACKVPDSSAVLNDSHFPQAALYAVSYHGKKVAYPLAYETTVLLYNQTLLENWAAKVNAGDLSGEGEGTSASDIEFDEYSDYELLGENESVANGGLNSEKTMTYEDYLPKTFDDILNFAQNYETPDNVESILKWDVNDIFYNYLFIGNYIDVGGNAGDNDDEIDIYNNDTLNCATAYQALNQFFSIDVESSEYAAVLQDFTDGKIVFTIATSDAISKVSARQSEMQAAYDREVALRNNEALERDMLGIDAASAGIGIESKEEALLPELRKFGYLEIPDVSDSLESRSMSVTDCLVINGYSEHKNAADLFATFVSTEYSGELFNSSGKLAASLDAGAESDAEKVFMSEYGKSVPLAKIVETTNLWVQLEITFTEIWKGESVEEWLTAFQRQILSQLGNNDE